LELRLDFSLKTLVLAINCVVIVDSINLRQLRPNLTSVGSYTKVKH